jgi:hypothetical protein
MWHKYSKSVAFRLSNSVLHAQIFRGPSAPGRPEDKNPSPPTPTPTRLGLATPCSSQYVLCFILVPRVLLNCLPIIHGLFSSILKFWEQCREPNTCDCPAQLYASVQMMSILRKAMWLPRPLCLGGDIFHIISPKEIHKLLETIWAFFKVSCVP